MKVLKTENYGQLLALNREDRAIRGRKLVLLAMKWFHFWRITRYNLVK
jgi:hypothetical protein